MLRRGLTALVLSGLCLAPAHSADVAARTPWDAATAALDKTVEAETAKLKGASYSVAAVNLRHPHFFSSHGFADVARKVAASPHTIYEIGSISKIFTGTMLMQMRDAGKASLDDPLQKHIPEFHMPSRFTGEARPTLRQLISHTSGLPRTTPRFSELEGERGSAEEVLASLADTEAVFAPYTRFKYSNIDVGLLGHGLARSAGLSWADYIARNILAPLGMSESSAQRTSLPAAQIALGYSPDAQGVLAPAPTLTFPPLSVAAGGILSSASDMARFAAWHLDDSDKRVLAAESRREMRAPLWMDEAWKSGNGVAWSLMRRNDEVLACHGGGTSGFNAMLCVDAKLGIAIVVLGNSMADSQGLALRLLDPLIAVAKTEKAAEDAIVPPLAAGAERFCGSYAHDIGLMPPVSVTIENNVLTVRDDNWGTMHLKPGRTTNSFTIIDNNALIGEAVTFAGQGADKRLIIGHGSAIYKIVP